MSVVTKKQTVLIINGSRSNNIDEEYAQELLERLTAIGVFNVSVSTTITAVDNKKGPRNAKEFAAGIAAGTALAESL